MYTPLVTSFFVCALMFVLNGFQPTAWMIPGCAVGLFLGIPAALFIGEFMPTMRVEESSRIVRSIYLVGDQPRDFAKGPEAVRGNVSYCLMVANDDGTFAPLMIRPTPFNTSISEGDQEMVGSLVVTKVVANPNSRLARWGLCQPKAYRHYQITVPKGTLSSSFKLQ